MTHGLGAEAHKPRTGHTEAFACFDVEPFVRAGVIGAEDPAGVHGETDSLLSRAHPARRPPLHLYRLVGPNLETAAHPPGTGITQPASSRAMATTMSRESSRAPRSAMVELRRHRTDVRRRR